MYPRYFRHHALLLAVCCSASLNAAAQAVTPQRLEPLDEPEPPAVTIRQQESQGKISQKKHRGQITEINVQSGGSTYVVKPNQQVGSALPGDAQSHANRAAQWQVMEFNLGREKDEAKAEAAQTAVPPPAPAVSAPAKK